MADAFGVERTKRGTVADVKYATADPKVFACGDMRRGQSLVVWALREGRDTAAVVDEKLMGYTNCNIAWHIGSGHIRPSTFPETHTALKPRAAHVRPLQSSLRNVSAFRYAAGAFFLQFPALSPIL